MAEVNINAILDPLAKADINRKNPALYQAISQLSQFVKIVTDGLEDQINTLNQAVVGNNPNNPIPGNAGLLTSSYMTINDDLVLLPQSSQVIEGSGVNFDDSTPNQRIIMSPDMYHALVGGI